MAGLTPFARLGGDAPIALFMLALLLGVLIEGNTQAIGACLGKARRCEGKP